MLSPNLDRAHQKAGKDIEDVFESIWDQYGKRAFVHRFWDASDVNGLNKGRSQIVMNFAQPADFLITFEGATFYAEVKRTINTTGFDSSNIKTAQWNAAVQQVAAGGLYFFFIFSVNADLWYRVPAQVFLARRGGRFKWVELTQYHWVPNELS